MREVDGSRLEAVPRLGGVPALDGLRGVAVLLVMAYHAKIPGFDGGNAGVDVFFVLSGFLITTLLLEERATAGSIRLGAFYMRRVLRLYPALVAACIVATVLAALKIKVFDASTSSLSTTVEAVPFALFYTMNFARALDWTGGGFLGHTWSLAIEEQFYLVWPLVVIVVLRRRTESAIGWIALVCAVGSAILRLSLQLGGAEPETLYNFTLTHVDGIFLGCAVAVMRRTVPGMFRRLGSMRLAVLAIAGAAAMVLVGKSMNSYGFAVVVATSALLVAHLLSQPDSSIVTALSHRVPVEIGRRSYGLYLYHWPIFLFLGVDTRVWMVMLGFGASFAAAWLSYAIVEEPFLRLKARWSTRRTATAPAT